MSDNLQKYLSADETSDPLAIAGRQDDDEFLRMYRSLSRSNDQVNEGLVRGSVDNGVIPESVRYGIMRRGQIEVYRGVVKSTSGDLFYFNWSPTNDDVHLVKADDPTKQWEADKLFKGCALGCDLVRKSDAPIDPGETIEEATEDDKAIPSAATMPVSEDQNIAGQARMTTDVHPGATASASPDDPMVGRDWHGDDVNRSYAAHRPGDAAPLDRGTEHWSATDLLKAWGRKMQTTAPRLAPEASDLETRYMTEVLGMNPGQIRKGFGALPPRHRFGFQNWKAQQLRGRLSGLESFLKGGR